jgi:hypothetical protein
MTWLFTVIFMVIAWLPAMWQTTPKNHVMLTEELVPSLRSGQALNGVREGISPHATAQSPGHPPAQRATAKAHVMLTIGSISPDAHRKSLRYHHAIPWRAGPRGSSAMHRAISEMVRFTHHDMAFYGDVHGWCMASVSTAKPQRKPMSC